MARSCLEGSISFLRAKDGYFQSKECLIDGCTHSMSKSSSAVVEPRATLSPSARFATKLMAKHIPTTHSARFLHLWASGGRPKGM